MNVGQLERHIYFILEGTQYIYFSNSKGEESCLGFGYPNTLLNGLTSFLREEPSEFGIQVLKKSSFLSISKTRFFQLREESPAIDRCWTLFLEQAILGLIDREAAMHIQDPRVRFRKLLSRSPHILQHIPQKYIASYLRMKPETLRRIIKEI